MLLSTPVKLGEALADFLKEKHFSAKDAVIGLPAKRLVTRRKEVPAAPVAIAASTLRLQAEGEFSSELDNLVMDFAGTPSPSVATTVLLVATNKVAVDECTQMGEAAGLRVHGVTSTGTALGRVSSKLPGGGSLVLSLGTTGAELVIQHGADAAQLKHMNLSGDSEESIGALAGEIRRTIASFPMNGTPLAMTLWQTGGGDTPRRVLEQRLNMPVTTAELTRLVATDAAGADAYAPAVALALLAMDPAGLPVDFLNSRLAPPKDSGLSLQKKAGVTAGVVAFLLLVFAGYQIYGKYAELSAINDTNTSTQRVADVKEAQQKIKRFEDAAKWIPTQVHYISVLRDLTQLFPPQPNTIWATSLASSPDGVWTLQGQSMSEALPGQLVQSMLSDQQQRFQQPVLTRSERGANSGVWNFVISFGYNMPAAPAASQPKTEASR